MAWVRLIGWWFSRRPISVEEARVLRKLLILQYVAFIFTLVMTFVWVYVVEEPSFVSYSVGFGTGWILSVRYFVWRFMG